MKIIDGMFLECFYEVARDYPHLKADDVIVDDLAMKLVVKPHKFDVALLPNLQGHIMSDLCAGLVGGLGFAPSANIGGKISIFEAVHGTAPDMAGKGIANPTALLVSGIMMLEHLGFMRDAWAIREALLVTLQEGAHTADFGSKDTLALNTPSFIDAIIGNLGRTFQPGAACPVHDFSTPELVDRQVSNKLMASPAREAKLVGVDLFIESNADPQKIGAVIATLLPEQLQLSTMSNRGIQVFPSGSVFTDCINQYRVRIEVVGDGETAEVYIFQLADQIIACARVCFVEMLMAYDGQKAYSLAQSQ